MKKILLILISLLCLTSCKKDDSKLILVTEAGFAPYEYYEKGEVVGVDIDIAKEIAKKIEQEMEYPGQIKVNVIREWRATEFAK